jgi:hypothetical protein
MLISLLILQAIAIVLLLYKIGKLQQLILSYRFEQFTKDISQDLESNNYENLQPERILQ